MAEYPLVEEQLMAWLDAAGLSPVYTETPADLDTQMPAYRVQVVGGGDGLETTRAMTVELCAYDETRGEATRAMAAADRAMRSLAASGTDAWYVDNVRLTFHPVVEPYLNTGLRQSSATYTLEIRPA